MKKYLMIGFAAVAFAACSNHDFETYSPEQVVKAEYDAKFISEFGKPGSQQNWGFGASTRAFTRATGDLANVVGNHRDANNWTRDGFHAPDPLTDGQKLRVQYYFQMNKIENPNQPDYGTKDFFMQQVYDGGDDPMTQYKGDTYSPEVYKSAANVTVISGEKMNKLTAGPDHIHVYNFNNGNCGVYTNVANWDQTNVNDETQQHPDQIELMLNTPTSCFGYFNSENSSQYDDQWTLVAGSVIDAFCNNADNGYEAWRQANHSDIEDKAVVDKWNRSFIGFDFKLTCDVDPFQRDNGVIKTAKYRDAGSAFYFWDDATQSGYKLAYNGTEFVRYTDDTADIMIGDDAVSLYSVTTNMYAADVLGMDNTDNHSELTLVAAYDPAGTNDNSLYLSSVPGQQSDRYALNLKFIEKMIGQGYYPVNDKSLKLWAKANDLTDGYYSDWIVSFMPATQGPGIPSRTYTGRIMAEDLSVSSSSDWDFNDVVFDYDIKDNKAYILLQAAGGTLPLNIGGTLNSDGEVVGGYEVHAAFGLTNTTTMVNTGAGATLDPVPLTLDNKTYTSNADIKLFVKKKVNGVEEWIEISAVVGEPAGKFVTQTTTDWVDEYANIKRAYSNFESWVQTGTGEFTPSGKNDLYFDRTTRNE
jgi:hypothetical protein